MKVLILALLLSPVVVAQSLNLSIEGRSDGSQCYVVDGSIPLSGSTYLSTWNGYNYPAQSREPEYIASMHLLNYKPSDKLIISGGYRSVNELTYNKLNNTIVVRLTYKLL